MVLSTLAKALLGGSLLAAGTGLSVGKAIFFSEDSNSEDFVTTSSKSVVADQLEEFEEEEATDATASEEPVKAQMTEEPKVAAAVKEVPPAPAKPEKKCTIYKILSSYSRTTSKAEESFLDKEVTNKSKSYRDIQGACDKANGKNIYLSKENVGSWWYPRYEGVYNKSKQNISWIVK